jgi:hypothetical protein
VLAVFLGEAVAVLLAGALADVAELDEEDEPEGVPVVSAAATPWPVATAVTNHAATAIPPYPPIFAARWHAVRDGESAGDALDEEEANRGLTRGLVAVMRWLRCRRG